MDDTGLPISMSRDRTTPSIGERMVALVSSSSERSTAACAWATAARACDDPGLGDAQLRPGDRLAVDRLLERIPRIVQF